MIRVEKQIWTLLLSSALGYQFAYAQIISPPLLPNSTSALTTSPPAKPCTAAENRQFDFWIGDWDVTTPNGKAAGTNRINPILGGCVLHVDCCSDDRRAGGVDDATP